MSVRIQHNRCWGCICGGHYDPVTPHTWMDDEDAHAAGLGWPLSAEDEAANPCACQCGGGPGACTTVRPVLDVELP